MELKISLWFPRRKKNKRATVQKKSDEMVPCVRIKKRKYNPLELLDASPEEIERKLDPTGSLEDHLKHYKHLLFVRALTSLKNHNSELYDEVTYLKHRTNNEYLITTLIYY